MTKTFLCSLGLIVALALPTLACEGDDCKGMSKEACKAACDAKAKAKVADEDCKTACDAKAKAKAKAGCDGAAKSACGGYIAKLNAAAAKGCKSSKAQLAVLYTAFNTTNPDVAAKGLGDLGAKAAKGCEASKAKLAKIKKNIFVVMPVSQQVERLVKGAAKGCEKSKAALAALGTECETGSCTKSLLAKAKKLEAHSAKGCKTSKALLASMRKITLTTVASSAPAKAKAAGDCGGCDAPAKAKAAGDCGGCDAPASKKSASNK